MAHSVHTNSHVFDGKREYIVAINGGNFTPTTDYLRRLAPSPRKNERFDVTLLGEGVIPERTWGLRRNRHGFLMQIIVHESRNHGEQLQNEHHLYAFVKLICETVEQPLLGTSLARERYLRMEDEDDD